MEELCDIIGAAQSTLLQHKLAETPLMNNNNNCSDVEMCVEFPSEQEEIQNQHHPQFQLQWVLLKNADAARQDCQNKIIIKTERDETVPLSKSRGEFDCPHCEKQYNSLLKLTAHLLTGHNILVLNDVVKSPKFRSLTISKSKVLSLLSMKTEIKKNIQGASYTKKNFFYWVKLGRSDVHHQTQWITPFKWLSQLKFLVVLILSKDLHKTKFFWFLFI